MMMGSVSPTLELFVLICMCCVTQGLYEDQAGKFDWARKYVGRVTQVYLPSAGSNIIVATEKNVLASLFAATGRIRWRQIFEKGDVGRIRALVGFEDVVLTVSNNSAGNVIRAWDVNTGFLKEETALALRRVIMPNTEIHWQVPKRNRFAVVALDRVRNMVQVSSYDFVTSVWKTKFITPSFSGNINCKFVNNFLFACLDPTSNSIYTLNLSDARTGSSFFRVDVGNFVDTKLSFSGLLILSTGTYYEPLVVMLQSKTNNYRLLMIESVHITVIRDFPNTIAADIIESSINNSTLVLRDSRGNFKLIDINFDFTSQDLQIASETVNLADLNTKANPRILSRVGILRKCGNMDYYLLVISEDHSLAFIDSLSYKLRWKREEALASIATLEMIDLPLSRDKLWFYPEFDGQPSNTFYLFGKRIFLQIQNFLSSVCAIFPPSFGSDVNDQHLIRDAFNMNKIIVAVTEPGQVFGLESSTGRVLWQQTMVNVVPYNSEGETPQFLLFLQRMASHTFPGQCTVVGKHRRTGESVLYVFNPVTGQPVQEGRLKLGYKVIQAALLSETDASNLHGLLFFDNHKRVHVYPPSALGIARSISHHQYLFTANIGTGLLTGYSMVLSSRTNLKANPLWNISIPKSEQRIVQVAMRRHSEKVHSQGRIMSDRSVIYKYLNPNLAAILTESVGVNKLFASVSLFDMVSGRVLYSTVHWRCRNPMVVALSENWLVYSYWNKNLRRTEVAVLELYEGKTQTNSSAFSSLNPPHNPIIVEVAAFVFPQAITAATVTITDKAITNKNLIFAVSSGSILELPKALLDPYRSLLTNRDEGILPYLPVLPVPAKNIINYNRSIVNVRGIYTAPTGLESTCLVLVYGLDLFYTRVMPSRHFDILSDNFNHILIVGIITVMVVVSYITRKLASKKALHYAWK